MNTTQKYVWVITEGHQGRESSGGTHKVMFETPFVCTTREGGMAEFNRRVTPWDISPLSLDAVPAAPEDKQQMGSTGGDGPGAPDAWVLLTCVALHETGSEPERPGESK